VLASSIAETDPAKMAAETVTSVPVAYATNTAPTAQETTNAAAWSMPRSFGRSGVTGLSVEVVATVWHTCWYLISR
jgi:hypothetical protein